MSCVYLPSLPPERISMRVRALVCPVHLLFFSMPSTVFGTWQLLANILMPYTSRVCVLS